MTDKERHEKRERHRNRHKNTERESETGHRDRKTQLVMKKKKDIDRHKETQTLVIRDISDMLNK